MRSAFAVLFACYFIFINSPCAFAKTEATQLNTVETARTLPENSLSLQFDTLPPYYSGSIGAQFSDRFYMQLRQTVQTSNILDGGKKALPGMDLKLKLKKNLSLNKLLKKRKTYIITLKKNSKKTFFYKKIGYKIIFVNSLNGKRDFNRLYDRIYKLGYSRVFVEAGLTLLNHLINNKLLNDLYIFKTNIKLGKNGQNNGTYMYLKKFLPKLLTIDLKGDKLFKKDF